MSEPIMVKDLGRSAQVLIFTQDNPLPPDSGERILTSVVALGDACPRLSALNRRDFPYPKDAASHDGVMCAVHVMHRDDRFELIGDVACHQHGTVRTQGGDAVAFIDGCDIEAEQMSDAQALLRLTEEVRGPWTAWVNGEVWRMEVLEIGTDYEPALSPLLDLGEDIDVYDISPEGLDRFLASVLGEGGERMIAENPWVFSELVPDHFNVRMQPADGDSPLGKAFGDLSGLFRRMLETEGFNDGDLASLSPALEAISEQCEREATQLESAAAALGNTGHNEHGERARAAARGLRQGSREFAAVLALVQEYQEDGS